MIWVFLALLVVSYYSVVAKELRRCLEYARSAEYDGSAEYGGRAK